MIIAKMANKSKWNQRFHSYN